MPAAPVISDSNVAPLYGRKAADSLTRAGLTARLLTIRDELASLIGAFRRDLIRLQDEKPC